MKVKCTGTMQTVIELLPDCCAVVRPSFSIHQERMAIGGKSDGSLTVKSILGVAA